MNGILEQRWAQIAGVALIVLTSFVVLRPFLVPIAWAAILAYASWPLHARIDRVLRGRAGLSAFAMTALMILVVVVPAVLVTGALVVELQRAYEGLRGWLAGGPEAVTTARGRAGPADPWSGAAPRGRTRGHAGPHTRRDRPRRDVRNPLDRAHPGAAPGAGRVGDRPWLTRAPGSGHRTPGAHADRAAAGLRARHDLAPRARADRRGSHLPGMGHLCGQHGRQRDQVVVPERRRADSVPSRLLRRPRRSAGVRTARALRGTGRDRASPHPVARLDGSSVRASGAVAELSPVPRRQDPSRATRARISAMRSIVSVR